MTIDLGAASTVASEAAVNGDAPAPPPEPRPLLAADTADLMELMPAVRQVVREAAKKGDRWSAILDGIAAQLKQ